MVRERLRGVRVIEKTGDWAKAAGGRDRARRRRWPLSISLYFSFFLFRLLLFLGSNVGGGWVVVLVSLAMG